GSRQPRVTAAGRPGGGLARRCRRHVRALGPAAPGAGAVLDLQEIAAHGEETMLSEFKTFIVRGNMIDLAVGIVIGAAFTTVVTSFVNDILMRPIGLLLGRVDFANLLITLSGGSYPSVAAAKAAGAATINYGVFINNVINLIIVGFVVFLVVKQVNRLRGPAPVTAPTTRECPACAMAIPLKPRRCPHCTSEVAAAR